MESTVDSESIVKAKTAIRETIIQKREALGNLKQNEKSLIIAQRLFEMDEFKKSKSVFCFLSIPNEVQTEVVIQESFRLGKKVFVPLLNSREKNLQVARIPSMDINFIVGNYGVREPAPEFREIVSFSRIDFAIAPGLAFDTFGNRIGYGGGYYDNFFKKISKDVIRVAIGYDFQILDLVPHSDIDEPVHFLVTEAKTLRCQGR